MDKSIDDILGKVLKKWVNQHHPPVNGRARLLWEASRVSHNKAHRINILKKNQFGSQDYDPNEWSHTLFNWVIENSAQSNIQLRVC
jgi:hypothetical protein